VPNGMSLLVRGIRDTLDLEAHLMDSINDNLQRSSDSGVSSSSEGDYPGYLAGNDVVCVMPQARQELVLSASALMLESDRCRLPLISLMADQVRQLRRLNVPCCS